MRNSAERQLVEYLDVSYVQGCKGRLFCLLASGGCPGNSFQRNKGNEEGAAIEPAEVSGDHFVLFIPPFGEEVNLCRRFHSLVRAQLTQAGLICVVPDLFGTGDSGGLLHEADYTIWLKDLHSVIRHFCCQRPEGASRHRLSIVATRAGCLLAADLIASLDQYRDYPLLANIVYVQPEKHGQDVISRLFRARIMAQRLAGNRSENTQSLWAAVEKGESVHAGGIELSPALCLSFRKQTLDNFSHTILGRKWTWFNLLVSGVDDSRNTSPKVNEMVLPSWVMQEHFTPPFWQTYEVEPDSSMVEAVACSVMQNS